jgi:hypothetical protein
MKINELCFRKTCENGSKKLFDKAENSKNNDEQKEGKVLKIRGLYGLTAFRLFQF